MKEFCIAAFGEIMLRLSPPGKKRFIQSLPGQLDACFGGAEANVCASLSILGAKNRMLSVLPKNPVTKPLLVQLRGLGCDVEHMLLTDSGRFGIYYAEHGSMQRGSNVFYDRDGSAIAETPAEAYDFDSMLSGCTHLLVSGITPGISRNAFEAVLKLVRTAAERNLFIYCDLNFRSKLWRWDPSCTVRELAEKCMREILPHVDCMIGSVSEMKDMFGLVIPDSMKSADPLTRYSYLAAQLGHLFPKTRYVAIPLRDSFSADRISWGGLLYDMKAGKGYLAPVSRDGVFTPYSIDQIVDVFGGGDAFTAGLIYALQSEDWKEPEKAIGFAAAASCLKHTNAGDFNFTELEEVLGLLEDGGQGNIKR